MYAISSMNYTIRNINFFCLSILRKYKKMESLPLLHLHCCLPLAFTYHARLRLFERRIRTDDIISALRKAEVLEKYLDDEPCPSVLVMGIIGDQVYHCVVAICNDNLRIITAYLPSEEVWTENHMRREKL